MLQNLICKSHRLDFSSLVKYITGQVDLRDIRISNCRAVDIQSCVSEIAALQELAEPTSPAVTAHLIATYPPGQTPSDEQIKSDELAVIDRLGLREYQRISAVHRDSNGVHLHVAVNAVNPKNFVVQKVRFP
jgi:hypothetical protein